MSRAPDSARGRPLDSARDRGLLFIVSAPSGTGKTTVAERLVARLPDLVLSRSYTSRAARVGEQDGVEPCGRKLDFLLQEMNREVNTMGSKADGLHVSELIISAKAELEKMREQVQNVE